MKSLLLAILTIPILSFFLMMFTAAFLGREILMEPPHNGSGLILFYLWNAILFGIYLVKTIKSRLF